MYARVAAQNAQVPLNDSIAWHFSHFCPLPAGAVLHLSQIALPAVVGALLHQGQSDSTARWLWHLGALDNHKFRPQKTFGH
jgi:hypothetical protein